MKTAIIATIITLCIIALFGIATAETAEFYPKMTVVIGYEKVDDLYIITCQDKEGNAWSFFDDEARWQIGDIANLMMWKATEAEEDDEVIEVYSEGHMTPAETARWLTEGR